MRKPAKAGRKGMGRGDDWAKIERMLWEEVWESTVQCVRMTLPLHALLCPSSVPLLCPWAPAWPISSRFLVIGDGEDPTGISGTEEPSSLIQRLWFQWASQEDNNYSSSNRANKYSRRISN